MLMSRRRGLSLTGLALLAVAGGCSTDSSVSPTSLAAPLHDPYYEEFFDIADIPRHVLKEVEYFFSTYKDLEGKRVQIVGWEKSEAAMRVIVESIDRYNATYLRIGP